MPLADINMKKKRASIHKLAWLQGANSFEKSVSYHRFSDRERNYISNWKFGWLFGKLNVKISKSQDRMWTGIFL